MPMKKGLTLANNVGIIDSDYYENPDNDGHIMIQVLNFSDNDITIKTDDYVFPSDYVFTGHLDALDHTITIIGSRTYLFDGLNGTYTTAQESDKTATWEANVHLEGSIWVPTIGWRAEVVNAIFSGGKGFKDGATITGYVKNCKDHDGLIENIPDIPTY